MKPKILYADLQHSQWLAAFDKLIALGVGTKLTAHGQAYRIVHWNKDHDYAFLQLRYRDGGKPKHLVVKRGDALMLELRP